MEQKHTKEPWFIGGTNTNQDEPNEIAIINVQGYCHAVALPCGMKDVEPDITKANAQRIVDCVNALAGIEDVEGFVRDAKEMQWVSGKDRLPEFGEEVFVEGGLAMLRGNGNWYSGMEEPRYTRVIEWKPRHWMPLPPVPDARKAGA